MTPKLTGAIAAGTLAIGILVGAAGTVLVHDATRSSGGMADMTQMHQMMDTMGRGEPMPMSGPDAAEHERHHPGTDR